MDKEEEMVKKDAPKGRAAWLDRYKAAYPDAPETIEDDALFEYADGDYSDIQDRYGKLNGANSRLAERVAEDPKLGMALSLMAGESKKSLPYAMGSVYGKDWLEGDLEEFEAGYQEHLKQLAESRKLQEQAAKNTETSVEHIEKYVSDNRLSQQEAAELSQNIVAFAENLLMGVVPPQLIGLIHKGLSYDQDVKEAIDTGAVQAKNERIDAELKKFAPASDVVDTGASSGAGKARPAPARRKGSFYDAIK